LKEDIANGKVKDVEVVDHEDLMEMHDERVDAAQEKYDANPSKNNAKKLEEAQRDRSNSARDSEVLIKGTIPSDYVTPPGGKPGAPIGAVPPPADTDDPSLRDDDE
jgi:filamentous hemagglutinin